MGEKLDVYGIICLWLKYRVSVSLTEYKGFIVGVRDFAYHLIRFNRVV